MRARSDFLAATLVAILTLLGGASALAPAPAAAMTNEEESLCAMDPDWFFLDDVGDECSELGSGSGSSDESGSADDDDGYYEETGDPCADYGECWEEWGDSDDGGFGDDSGDDIVEDTDPDEQEDRLVRALEEAAGRASAEYQQCRQIDLELGEADEVLASLIEGDRQAGPGSGVSGSVQTWLRTRDLLRIERDECFAHADAALARVYDERERLGLPRYEGQLFHRDEEDLDKALGFVERTGASSAVTAPPPAVLSQAFSSAPGLIAKPPDRSDRLKRSGKSRRAKKSRARR
jgi:hypothetical protein